MMSRRIVAGLSTGAIANAIQMLMCLWDDRALTAELFIAHFTVVLVFHTLAAVLFAETSNNRLWAAVIFLVPFASVSARELEATWGTSAAFGGVVGAFAIGVLWTRMFPRRGAPFLSATAGAAGAAAIPYMRSVSYWNQIESEIVVALAGLIFFVAILISLFAGRPKGGATPSIAWSARRLVACGLISLVPLPFLQHQDIPAPGVDDSVSSPSVILIVLDTVRADHLELYGYERNTMPALARFAREHAVVAERAISNGPSSLPTHASLFTGLYPVRHGAHKPFLDDPTPPPYAYPLHPSIPTVASLLAQAGYWTVAVCANTGALDPYFGLDNGFDVYRAIRNPRRVFVGRSPWGIEKISRLWPERIALGVGRIFPFMADYLLGVPYQRAEQITNQAIEAVELAGNRPLFLFLNYMDAHSPYFPPPEFMDRFPGRSRSLLTSRFDEEWARAVVDGDIRPTDEERTHYTALYDAELSYLDQELDRLLQWLQQRPDWDEMLVIITSDHGDAIGDHGDLEHSHSLYDEITRVPLIIKAGTKTPGAARVGSVMSGLIESVDVFPSILEHAGLPIPSDIDGSAWAKGRTHSFGWLYPSPGQRGAQELRSVQSDGWKLVQSSSGEAELFNIERDPHEMLDLSVAEASIHWSLLQVLQETERKPNPPREQADELSEETLDELRALGYVD